MNLIRIANPINQIIFLIAKTFFLFLLLFGYEMAAQNKCYITDKCYLKDIIGLESTYCLNSNGAFNIDMCINDSIVIMDTNYMEVIFYNLSYIHKRLRKVERINKLTPMKEGKFDLRELIRVQYNIYVDEEYLEELLSCK